jgi:hypothetical protein
MNRAHGAVAGQAGQRILVLRLLQALLVKDLQKRGRRQEARVAEVLGDDDAVGVDRGGKGHQQHVGVAVDIGDRTGAHERPQGKVERRPGIVGVGAAGIDIGFQVALVNQAARFQIGVENRDHAGVLIVHHHVEQIVHGGVEADGRQLDQFAADAVLFLALLVAEAGRPDVVVEQLRRRCLAEGPGDEIALDQVAAGLPAGDEFAFGLDAFGNDLRAEHMGEVGDRGHEELAPRIAVDPVEKEAVDLDVVGRDVVQEPQFGRAPAEVVERESESRAGADR